MVTIVTVVHGGCFDVFIICWEHLRKTNKYRNILYE
jgi:hypothetical protein